MCHLNKETGINTPDLEMLQDLSTLFNLSINELLIGKKLPKTKVSSEVEKVTYEILLQNERKSKKIKNLKILLLVFFVLIFLFLLNYFFTFYNSVNIDLLLAIGKNFDLNGILVTSRETVYLDFNDITLRDGTPVDKIELYYLDDNKKRVIYTSNNNDGGIISDTYKYEEYFDFNNMNDIKNNLYIKVFYNNKSEDVKIKLVKGYSNKSFFIRKDNHDDTFLEFPKKHDINNVIE